MSDEDSNLYEGLLAGRGSRRAFLLRGAAAGRVFSMKRHLNPASYWAFAYFNVESIEQTGAWEVTVHMKRPDVIFAGLMATPAGGVGPQAYVTAKGKSYGTAKAGPVGTGPFKFTSWNAGSNITLSRNDSYWDTAHAPKTKSVVFSFIP